MEQRAGSVCRFGSSLGDFMAFFVVMQEVRSKRSFLLKAVALAVLTLGWHAPAALAKQVSLTAIELYDGPSGAPDAFREQHPVNRRELGRDDSLLRVVCAGLGGDSVAERLLAHVFDLPAPAGEHVAALDHPGERRGGRAEGDVARGDPLGVVTADRREQALAGRARRRHRPGCCPARDRASAASSTRPGCAYCPPGCSCCSSRWWKVSRWAGLPGATRASAAAWSPPARWWEPGSPWRRW